MIAIYVVGIKRAYYVIVKYIGKLIQRMLKTIIKRIFVLLDQ